MSAWAAVCPLGVLGPLHRPGTQLGRLPSAALLGPFAPALTFNRPPIFLMLRAAQRASAGLEVGGSFWGGAKAGT